MVSVGSMDRVGGLLEVVAVGFSSILTQGSFRCLISLGFGGAVTLTL